MKNVLITGATSGIGETTARYLSEQGYGLVLIGRNSDKLDQLKKELNNVKLTVAFDLANVEDIEQIFIACANEGIMLDGMVHAAGLGANMPIRRCTMQLMDPLMRVSYYAFVELAKWFSNRKYSNEGASIVGMSSISSVHTGKGMLPYTAPKAAMDNAVKVMAVEFMKRKIRVNSVRPAWVKTPLIQSSEGVVDYDSVQPLGLIDPLQVAYLIEFLLSDKAQFITGSHYMITAGMEVF